MSLPILKSSKYTVSRSTIQYLSRYPKLLSGYATSTASSSPIKSVTSSGPKASTVKPSLSASKTLSARTIATKSSTVTSKTSATAPKVASAIPKTATTTSTTSTSKSAAPSSTTSSSTISKPTTLASNPSLFSTSTSLYNIGTNVTDSAGIKSFNETTPSQSSSDSIDWTQSYQGLGLHPFPLETAQILTEKVSSKDIEIKPEGLIYLPEIKYRRILNRAFGPGGWGLAPRSETIITPKMITREYALVAHGRLVAIARGEQDYFDPSGIPTATEGCKSNAMMRCCKDLGIASELWDPRFIREFKKKYAHQVYVEYVPGKKKKMIWMRKDDEVVYPYKEVK